MTTTTHMAVDQVDCPDCEAPAGDPCVDTRFSYALPGFHENRYWAAELHEITHGRVPDSDVIVLECDECGWTDAQ